MSAPQDSSLQLPPILPTPTPTTLPPLLPPHSTGSGTPRVIFTRQLWQRTMPAERSSLPGVLDKSHDTVSTKSRRTSSTVSTASQQAQHAQQWPSPSRRSDSSKTPLTPEESPPSRNGRKRSAAIVDEDDKELHEATPSHSRGHSGDSTVQVCICQPDPKIPRPRNAFILYRQHYQGNVVAQHPGLANPEISKIIGEQWRNEAIEVKNEWKALAEEEKLRHQAQYPQYRYQPKRAGRRNSVSSEAPGSAGEKARCNKCGGRTIISPNTTYSTSNNISTYNSTNSIPPTPGSVQLTPLTRTLPAFNNLAINSPASSRGGSGQPFPQRQPNMTPSRYPAEERDEVGPLSPGSGKKRRYNDGHAPQQLVRAMPPHYNGQPGTPFPFAGAPPPHPHPYPPATALVRRESLPGLRGVVSPQGYMAPPPRPGMGYQQHRLSQGHMVSDRSLTLPPLQTSTGGVAAAIATAGTGKSAEEVIMGMSFVGKIKVLGRIAPPAAVKKDTVRGPVIAVEGDSVDAVAELAAWLADVLAKDEDRQVKLFAGPDLPARGEKLVDMGRYHLLAAAWSTKSAEIIDSVTVQQPARASIAEPPPPPPTAQSDTSPATASSARRLDENYSDSDDESTKDAKPPPPPPPSNPIPTEPSKTPAPANPDPRPPSGTDSMDVDAANPRSKPVALIPNFSLAASNAYACTIPIADSYSAAEHWQWTATQWRGILGPDLTIYVEDAGPGGGGGGGRQTVDILEADRVFVVRRSGGGQVEASVLRRLGFEVSEWVRGHGVKSAVGGGKV